MHEKLGKLLHNEEVETDLEEMIGTDFQKKHWVEKKQ